MSIKNLVININDPFFDSLKSDYKEFEIWFKKKADDSSYVFVNNDGFLYLKYEDGWINDSIPPLPPARRLKVGTFKINAHGTKLGERFIKKYLTMRLRLKLARFI